MPGRPMSRSTTSGRCSRAASMAAWPSWATRDVEAHDFEEPRRSAGPCPRCHRRRGPACPAPRSRGRAAGSASPGPASTSGRRTVNSLPLPSLARGGDGPAVHLGELLDEREPDAEPPLGAGERAVPLGEEVEHLRAASRAGCRPRCPCTRMTTSAPSCPADEPDAARRPRCTSRRWSGGSRGSAPAASGRRRRRRSAGR